MKNTRGLSILLAVLVVIACSYLIMDYARQQKQQAALTARIEGASHALAILPAEPADLDQQLADAIAANAAALKAISNKDLNTTAVIDTILENSGKCGLELTPLTTDPWMLKKIGGVDYRILPLKFQVKGPLEGLTGYLELIGNDAQFPYLAIATADIVNSGQTSSDAVSVAGSITANLTVNILIRQTPSIREDK